MSRLLTKRVYEPKESKDGTRVLVMRLWPRGVRKSHADLWLKELGPGLPVLKTWKAGRISWTEFSRRYLTGLDKPKAREQLRQLRRLGKKGAVTLLCACAEEGRCHRSLLRGVL